MSLYNMFIPLFCLLCRQNKTLHSSIPAAVRAQTGLPDSTARASASALFTAMAQYLIPTPRLSR